MFPSSGLFSKEFNVFSDFQSSGLSLIEIYNMFPSFLIDSTNVTRGTTDLLKTLKNVGNISY